MKKLLTKARYNRALKKLLLKMKLTIAIFLFSLASISATTYAQITRMEISSNKNILELFREIEDKSEFYFFYQKDDLKELDKVNVNVEDATVMEILDDVLKGTVLDYTIVDRYIIVRKTGDDFGQEIIDAQQKIVSGKVADVGGQPLPGVTVLVKGTTNGTVTGTDGIYSISNIPSEATLVFSFMGMRSQEIIVGTQTTINVTLAADVIGIEEVVAVGYGTQKKVNLTGSVYAVSGKDIAKRQVGQTSMVLQGVIPGVTVTQTSGQPGYDGGIIRIRGIGTLGDSNPLILVDNVESGINNIDPNIIESISVLKDAASASIYGSRAANGVILITTKRAKEGFSVDYSNYFGVQEPTNLRNKVNAVSHMEMMNTATTNAGISPIFNTELIANYPSLHASDPVNYPDTDWQKEAYINNGFTQNHFLNLSGGTDRLKFLAAFGYYNQEGIINNTDFERFTFRLNSDIKFSEKFTAHIDMFLRQMNVEEPGEEIQQIFQWISVNHPIEPVYNSYGYAATTLGANALALIDKSGYRQTLTPSATLNLGFDYHITDHLSLSFNYAPHLWITNQKNYWTIVNTYRPDGSNVILRAAKGSLYQQNSHNINNNLRAILNFDKSFAEHNVKMLAGFSQEDLSNRWFGAYRDVYTMPQFDVLNAGSTVNQQASGTGYDWALRSLFGRVNYGFADKYLFEANIRYDGSSRFATGHKYGVFPSISAGWRISEEKFWSPVEDVIGNFKIRASWGQLGNQNIGVYPFDTFYQPVTFVFNNRSVDGRVLTTLPNYEISWETTKMTDFGIDMTLFNKLSLSFDYYIKNTSGILLRLDVPKFIGLAAPYQNAGEVRNAGWDFSLNYSGKKNDFSYDLNFVLSDVKNEIIDLHGIEVLGMIVNHEGFPMNSIYGYEAIGYFQNEGDITNSPTQFGRVIPGSIKYKNMNDDGVINADDRKIIGNTIPRYTFGFNTNLSWKNFDMDILLQGVGKVDGYLYGHATFPFYSGGTALEMHKDYWTPDNTNASFPSMVFSGTNDTQTSSFWVKNASYLRVKNLQIGYTFQQNLLRFAGIKRCRVYLSGQNLFTFDKFWKGFDVEAPVGEGSYYPQVINYTVGINVNF